MRVVIVGGSFGGLTAAYELRSRLGKNHEITLVSDNDKFVFIPSLPWVSLGWKKPEDVVFDLRGPLASKGIEFRHAKAEKIDTQGNTVITDSGDISYDYLLIATGAYLEFEAIPGLGPEGYTQSVCTLEHAKQAYDAWKKFLQDPGEIVIGAAQGASCFGPAYEQVFMVDTYLRRIKKRHHAPITFITSEPYLGHFGIAGLGKSRRSMEDEFAERDIKAITSAVIQEVTPDAVKLKSGEELRFKYAMIIPPFRGVDAVMATEGLGNPRGFVPVDQHYRHVKYENIYAAGVAVAMMPPETTPVPIGVPKTGHMTEQMARIAAGNIAAEIEKKEKLSADIRVVCFLDMGDTAVLMSASPVLPPREKHTLKKHVVFHWVKAFFERYYLWKMRRGITWLP
jgi:sulfide:quinone oxidoreductase